MGNTNNLDRPIKQPDEAAKTTSRNEDNFDDKMYNPWYYFSRDLIFIRDSVWLILRFIVENSILAFSFNNKDEVDGINGEITELYIFDRCNWKSIAYQVFTGVISAPLLVFSFAMVTIGSFRILDHIKAPTAVLLFLLGLIPIVIFGIFSLPLLTIAYIQITLILLYFLLRILQSFELDNHRYTIDTPTNVRVQTFFLNGICVNEHWANQNCTRLMRRFKEKVGTVKPIYNPSYGIVADLFESIALRNFRVNSTAVCVATDTLERALKITKEGDIVRFISHSQGTILANLAIQRLYYRLSLENKKNLLKRLHVHTFACADRSFTNPEGLLGCVEHYVNKHDPIVIFGIDRFSEKEPNIFEDKKGRGHLFNKFYSLNKNSYEPRGHNNEPELLSLLP
jgi:hypothetical protein